VELPLIIANTTILLTVAVLLSCIPAEDLDLKEPTVHVKLPKSLPGWLTSMDYFVAMVSTQQSQPRLVS